MAAVMDTAANGANNGLAGLDVDAVEGRVARSLTTRVRKLIDDFPERSLDVIRAWMAEGRY